MANVICLTLPLAVISLLLASLLKEFVPGLHACQVCSIKREVSAEEKAVKKKMVGDEEELWPRIMGKAVDQWKEGPEGREAAKQVKITDMLNCSEVNSFHIPYLLYSFLLFF